MPYANAGELRQELARQGILWTVNPALADADALPSHGLGGDLAKVARAETVGRVDVKALVSSHPTTNTLLASDLVARGVLNASAVARLQAGPGPLHPAAGAATAGAAAGGGAALLASVDWRSRYGTPWITEIRDQDGSEHCWIYSATAMIEAMVRIEHCTWCTRSEGDFIEANGINRNQTGDPATTLTWVAGNGMTDLDCVPWADRDPADRTTPYWTANPPPTQPWSHCSNRSGRTVKIPAYQGLGNIDDQKAWIANVGPIVACFTVWADFDSWSGTKPYMKSNDPSNYVRGGHCILIVGYDDTKKCWIIKNSWGTGWGDSGFGLIGYGQADIDSYTKYGLQYTNPDPWTKRRNHGGGMIESGDGDLHRNFELIAPSANNSVTHWWRNNGVSNIPWSKAEVLGNDAAAGVPPTLTGTTYNRNFEFLYPTISGQIRHWYFDQASGKWNEGEVFANQASAPVGFVESSYGPGNFEVVYCTPAGRLQHYWRDSAHAWHQGVTFGSGIRTMGSTLLQSTWGNLELVAVLTTGQMQHWWRNDGGNRAWAGDQVFGTGVSSAPVMIQGQYGMSNEYQNGNFELCVAMPDGTVEHWWRNNGGGFAWTKSATFGTGVKCVVALLESSYGFDLEMVVIRTDGNLQHYWRDGGGWHAGAVIGPTH